MYADIVFMFIVLFTFILGGAILLLVDFCVYIWFDWSPLCAVEKFFFDRFGK
jgi:hypothetical protein